MPIPEFAYGFQIALDTGKPFQCGGPGPLWSHSKPFTEKLPLGKQIGRVPGVS